MGAPQVWGYDLPCCSLDSLGATLSRDHAIVFLSGHTGQEELSSPRWGQQRLVSSWVYDSPE